MCEPCEVKEFYSLVKCIKLILPIISIGNNGRRLKSKVSAWLGYYQVPGVSYRTLIRTQLDRTSTGS